MIEIRNFQTPCRNIMVKSLGKNLYLSGFGWSHSAHSVVQLSNVAVQTLS